MKLRRAAGGLVQVGLRSRFAVRGKYSWQEGAQQALNNWLVPRYQAGWARMQAAPLPTYEAGSWGPTESDAFLSMEGRSWRQP